MRQGDDATGGVVSHRIHPPFIPGVLDGCKAGVQGVAPALSVQNGTHRAACAGAKALHQACASVGRRAKRGGQKMHGCTTTCTACRRRRRKRCSSAAAPGAVQECELGGLEACRACTELAQGRAPTRRFALQGACRGAEVCAKGVQGVHRACTSWGTGCAVVEVALHVCAQSHAEDA